jgi:transposase-like protein
MAREYRERTAESRSAAVARSYEIGVVKTCRELDVPESTLYAWRKQSKSGSTSTVAVASKKKKASRRIYSSEERAAAVELSREIGVTAACKLLGIGSSTLYAWRGRSLTEVSGQAAAETEGVNTETEPDGGTSDETAVKPGRSKAKGVARRYTPSEKAQALEYMSEHGASATEKKFGMTRFSLYDWKRKVERAARGEGDSPTSGPDPKDVEEQRNAEILAMWKKHPGLGPSQIRNQLRRQGIKAGVKVVRDVMIDAGYRPPRSKRVPHDERFEAVRPNHLWHLDFVQRFINRCSVFTLIIIDDYSRFVIGHCCVDAERADPVIRCFEEAVERYGRPEMVLHDKGSAFWSWKGVARFTRLLTEMGIDQIPAQFKEWNGKLECFNANIQKEFFKVHRFYDVNEMRRELRRHLHWYNHKRTHHALGGIMVPADRHYGREDEVRELMAAGAGGFDIHTINLGDRPMDFFRVVQQGAETEIWLMGKKLLTLGK